MPPYQRFPKVEILSLSQHEIKFVLSDTDTSVANTLRRIVIAEVPTLAVDLVESHENTTVLNDEYLAHRLGLIPIRYTGDDGLKGIDCQDVFLPHRECVCYERCPRCSVEFELDVHYNVNVDEEEVLAPLTVTSKDLHSNNPCVQPAHFLETEQDETHDEGIAIVKLGPNQRLKLKAIARLGVAKEHAKWSPVAVATYRFWPKIHINSELMSTLTIEQRQEIVDACPDRILEMDPITGEVRAVDDAWDICTYTEDLQFTQEGMKRRQEDDDFVTVTPSEDRFVFTVETTGCIDADEVVMAALKVLKKRLTYLAQELESLKAGMGGM